MTARAPLLLAASIVASVVASIVASVGAAACAAPAEPPACPVPGQLGAGAFAAYDCRGQPGCLDGWRFAARSVETMVFCPADGQEVTAVVSDDPGVTVTSSPIVLAPGQIAFDLAAGA